MKHTPGPWEIKDQDIIGNEQNGYVCTWSGRSANARIIAAAPSYHEHSYNLAVLVLQSELYQKDADVKLEVDNVIAIWKKAEGK